MNKREGELGGTSCTKTPVRGGDLSEGGDFIIESLRIKLRNYERYYRIRYCHTVPATSCR